MRKYAASILSLLFLLSLQAQGATNWTEGKHYFLVQPAQATSVAPGKVEVAEAFSYGCPACDHFQPVIERLRQQLPDNAEMVYVPASFNPSEQWPLFQRAYLAAKALGIAEKTHAAMFNAIWNTGELAVVDPRTHRIKSSPPTLEDVAEFYASKSNVTADKFIATAKSFSVQLGMKRADAWIKACRVDQTPTIVVNGKYRLYVSSAGGIEQTLELVNWLVAKESGASP